jgi:hypothetical protein
MAAMKFAYRAKGLELSTCQIPSSYLSSSQTKRLTTNFTKNLTRNLADKMIVMPANHSSAIFHYWVGKYPGKLGWLIGPTALPKTKLRKWVTFALDNDAFSAFTKNREWDETAWIAMLDRVKLSGMSPRWVLVPDVVADRKATLEKWEKYQPIAVRYGWPLAIAVQDGMTPSDLPDNCVVFVGGSTSWKWRTLPMWCATGRRIHVGRVNEVEKLFVCERLGVESVDGTGWMQGTDEGRQARALGAWLAKETTKHPEFNFTETLNEKLTK